MLRDTLRFALPLLTAFVTTAAWAQQMPPMMGPPRLVVLNMSFYGRGANSLDPTDPEQAVRATGILRSELKRYDEFSLVDSMLTAEALAHAESSGIPCVTIDCARSVAQELGARWVVTSKVSKISNLIWYMFGQLVDVRTGQLLTDQELELKGVATEMVPEGAASLSRRLAQAAGAEPLAPRTEAGPLPAAGPLDAAAVRARLAAATDDSPANFSGLDLSGLDLHAVDFRRADLTRARLVNSNLSGANLFTCDLTDAVATGANFEGANLDGTTLRRTDLQKANLRHASLFATIIEAANLSDADLSGSRIIGYLKNARLLRARLDSANIGADPGNQSMGVMRAAFVGADLTGADLTGANLFKADFSYGKLIGAILRDANLSNAELVQTDLSEADVTGATLAQANLNGAIFTGAKGVKQLKGLDQARNRDKAVFDEHME